MILGIKQENFSLALAKLIIFANENGYGVRVKHVLRCKDCKTGEKNSLHKLGIAADLVLTINGIITWNLKYYNLLHDYWDKLGGSKRIFKDLMHFSFEHNGVR